MTEQERQARITALIRERDGYLAHGDTGHADQVTAELRRLGADARTPHQRAARRVTRGG